jgi:tetratricopeptide (TPR) repeat protein
MRFLIRPFLTAVLIISSFALREAIAQEPALSGPAAREMQEEALFIDATKARMLDDQKQEEELLKLVVKELPDRAAPYFHLARLYMKQSRIDQAEQHIRKAVALDKNNPWYKAQFAEILVFQNKFEEAGNIYSDLGSAEKHNQEFLFKGAMLYQKAGKNKEALALFDQLIKQLGADEELLLQKQQLLLRMNDLDGAVKVAQQLIEQNPREGRYYANLADLYESNNQPDKAIAIYEKALKDFPGDPTIQYGLAEYYKKKNDTAKYATYIRQAILNQTFDNEIQTGILLGYLQELSTDTNRKAESIDITRQLVKQHPDNTQLLAIYGEVLRMNGQNAEAAEQYKKALALDPARFSTWQSLLVLYTDRNDADSLIKYSEQAMRYFPNQALVHYLHGIGHFNKKSFSSAVKSMNRAIDLQPEDNQDLLSQMHASLGDIYNETKEYTLSDSSYERALRFDPRNATVLNNYSYYLSLRGVRLEDAARMSKLSLEIRPGEATFLDTYGWVLYRQGKYEQAKQYIEDALKANPAADGTLWEHLGDVFYKLGDISKAVDNWKIAKEKGTENQQIDKKIQDRKLYE